jgi:hypothetical protein
MANKPPTACRPSSGSSRTGLRSTIDGENVATVASRSSASTAFLKVSDFIPPSQNPSQLSEPRVYVPPHYVGVRGWHQPASPIWTVAVGERPPGISDCESPWEDTADHRPSPCLMAANGSFQPSVVCGKSREPGRKPNSGPFREAPQRPRIRWPAPQNHGMLSCFLDMPT